LSKAESRRKRPTSSGVFFVMRPTKFESKQWAAARKTLICERFLRSADAIPPPGARGCIVFTLLALLAVAAAYPTWKAFQNADSGQLDKPAPNRPNRYL
jgi:hypothetical protein